MRNGYLLLIVAASLLAAGDPYCPRYPDSVRTEVDASLSLDREAEFYARAARRGGTGNTHAAQRLAASASFIDQLAAKKMNADGVVPAPPAGDAEFLRRVSLDLTGRIPSVDRAAAFLDDSNAGKRAALIDELLSSPAYADQITLLLINRFKVTRSHESISTVARNTFYNFVRGAMANDRPYNQFVRELISAAGEVDTAPGTQFFARWMDVSGPIQDSWDDITDKITTTFLGYKTECVSCHNGRGHLEKINLHLSRRTRRHFWEMSAFLSRMQFVRLSDDPVGFRPRIIVVDRDSGAYSGSVPSTNPGNRPTRNDAVTNPAFFTTGDKPGSGAWRQELGRMVTSDRQFALATANYVWDYLFGSGIVDPPDGWDMDRVDPSNPPGGDWPIQNSNPELLNKLADFLIANDYRLKPLIREIVMSDTYQLSARYQGTWKPAFVRYFARHEARRLSAEQMYDSMITATHTEQPMATTYGLVRYANQLPDPTEPSTDSRVVDFMNQLGRGDWMLIDRLSAPTILGLLYQMNDAQNVNRSLGLSNANVGVTNRVHQIDADYPDDAQAIRRMFLASLTRYPTDQEMAIVMGRRSGPRYQWLSDLQWALLNKLDFAFN
jgi:Protein of unknown function (DUF1549)/Protein of unknown function (DUF1553)